MIAHRRAAQPRGVLRHGVQHRLEIGRRAGDDPQHLAGGGLLLQRLREVAVAILQLLEQARVLDGDDRLVGEGLQQRDLRIREGPHLLAANHDRPDRRALAQQRGHQHGPQTPTSLSRAQANSSSIARNHGCGSCDAPGTPARIVLGSDGHRLAGRLPPE